MSCNCECEREREDRIMGMCEVLLDKFVYNISEVCLISLSEVCLILLVGCSRGGSVRLVGKF